MIFMQFKNLRLGDVMNPGNGCNDIIVKIYRDEEPEWLRVLYEDGHESCAHEDYLTLIKARIVSGSTEWRIAYI